MTQARLSAVDNAALTHHADQLDLDKWPGPVVRLYLGKATQQDVEEPASANAGDKCESDFYIGEWELGLNDHSKALSLLHAAADKCPQNFIEREAAKAEIMRTK
jgi:rhomboid protease GluP